MATIKKNTPEQEDAFTRAMRLLDFADTLEEKVSAKDSKAMRNKVDLLGKAILDKNKDGAFTMLMSLLVYADTLEENGYENESETMHTDIDNVGIAILKL